MDVCYELHPGEGIFDGATFEMFLAALGLAPERSYESFAERAPAERARADGIEAVAIVAPNKLDAAASAAFLAAGIHVISDKSLATSLAEALPLATLAKAKARVVAVT